MFGQVKAFQGEIDVEVDLLTAPTTSSEHTAKSTIPAA